MKLLQGQIWKQDDHYIRTVRVERLAVEYKVFKNLSTKVGVRHLVTKKAFCRLLKNAVLLSPAELATTEKTTGGSSTPAGDKFTWVGDAVTRL